ncbi:hypothetical protein CCZ27_00745 [Thauera sinica]|nr:hypothetical protein CCZ27_00745 [Thauera sp. K11]
MDDHGLQACQINDAGGLPAAGFAPGDTTGFAAWLARQPKERRYRLVFDLADEHVQVESMPRVRGADRRALLARRFATHFGDSPVTWMQSLGRGTDAPHQEKVVLHGLARPAALAPWLDAIGRRGARLEAAGSATLLLGHFAPRTLRLDGSLLLVAFTRCGMRLSHVEQGTVRFTRLVAGIRPAAEDWLHELERTCSYLLAQPDLCSGGLRTIVLDPSPAAGATPHAGDAAADRGPRHVAAAALLPAGSVPAGDDMGAIEVAQLHWLADMPRALRCHMRERSAGAGAAPLPRIVPYGTAAAVAGALVLAAFRWADAAALDREAGTIEARAASLRSELAGIESARGPLPAAAGDLLAVLGRFEREQTRHLPAPVLFSRLASALDAAPGIELDHLSWQREADAEGATDVKLGLRLDDAGPARLDALVDALERQGGRAFQRDVAEAAAMLTGSAADSPPMHAGLRFRFDVDGPQ